MNTTFEFREIKQSEAAEAAEIEQICFPPNEANTREEMMARTKAAPELFLVAVDKEAGRIAGFLNGLATNETVFRDEFFTDASLHDREGENIMLLGLDVLPEYRGHGIARELFARYCERERNRGRARLILTCHAEKIPMYEKFGFRDLGISGSLWGGVPWHEMEIVLNGHNCY